MSFRYSVQAVDSADEVSVTRRVGDRPILIELGADTTSVVRLSEPAARRLAEQLETALAHLIVPRVLDNLYGRGDL